MIRGTLQILYPSPCQSKECTTYHSGANANIYHYIPCTPSHQLGEGLSKSSMMIIYGLKICIVLVCIMCIIGHRRKKPDDRSSQSSMTFVRGISSPYSITSENTINTLKSLRTSLRD